MIARINDFFSPLEKYITRYQKYIGYFILVLAFAAVGYIFDEESIGQSGEQALLVLWIILWLPIIARVIGLRIAQRLLPLRKELGILMGTLALVHSSRFFLTEPTFIFTSDFWYFDGQPNYLAFGFFALILSLPLTFTSNLYSMKRLGKWWKRLHRLAYFIALFTVIHVVLLNLGLHYEVGPVIILLAYSVGKYFEWKGYTLVRKETRVTYPKGQKWLCVPCGYIYDPAIGDIDSGIEPGTEFTDIPDDWRCPICSVMKSDFVPLKGEGSPEHGATIREKNFLNPTTLELVIETDEDFSALPGQFMTFRWYDSEGIFMRQYSIVEQRGKIYTFTIKITPSSRGGAHLLSLEIGAKIAIGGIFGSFLLTPSTAPKIFVATGTGLAPIYHMIRSLESSIVKKSLYFSVASEVDLFYVEKLRAIPDLDLHIHTTREDVAGFTHGRVDIDSIEASPETEWYLCGNPRMIAETRDKLEKRGFIHIFSEQFS